MKPVFYLGCPVWAHAAWRGNFFTTSARREEFLPQYASVFRTAEGNTTFYGLPSAETVARWAVEAPEDFRFCFKFPRAISHEQQLGGTAESESRRFFERLAPLAGRCGPFFLQLHESFGANRLETLRAFLAKLPKDFTYAVEVRHRDFFDGAAKEQALDRVLGEAGVDRVNFDTRGLFAAKATDDLTRDAVRKKPRVPVRFTAIGARPFVRFVGDPEIGKNAAIFEEWAAILARWIKEGRTPYFFVHHPDDGLAPAMARSLHRRVYEREPAVGEPPTWPSERDRSPAAQLDLF